MVAFQRLSYLFSRKRCLPLKLFDENSWMWIISFLRLQTILLFSFKSSQVRRGHKGKTFLLMNKLGNNFAARHAFTLIKTDFPPFRNFPNAFLIVFNLGTQKKKELTLQMKKKRGKESESDLVFTFLFHSAKFS